MACILLTESIPWKSQVLHELLELCDYDVIYASISSLSNALALIRDHEPHLVIVDYIRPYISSCELCRGLRAEYSHEALPILLLTTVGAAEEALQAGASAVIQEPCEMDEIQGVLNILIGTEKSLSRS